MKEHLSILTLFAVSNINILLAYFVEKNYFTKYTVRKCFSILQAKY